MLERCRMECSRTKRYTERMAHIIRSLVLGEGHYVIRLLRLAANFVTVTMEGPIHPLAREYVCESGRGSFIRGASLLCLALAWRHQRVPDWISHFPWSFRSAWRNVEPAGVLASGVASERWRGRSPGYRDRWLLSGYVPHGCC